MDATDERERHSGYYARIADLAETARHERETFEPPEAVDEERALRYARDGFGDVVALYIEARTAAWDVEFSARELSLLHRATNDYLSLYTRCHGVAFDTDVTVREAAEVLLKTHNIVDTAQLVTKVPGRD
ncbi:hypothetical protein [Salinigranum halophilum]|jgi:hypothetical protein|uniref:hypothetical protein n=1 Tax=Salinigranum halophilum TaxID=2565931 RepID=UPI00115E9E4A|nr:hypothetical protein [Salinigranum halophilum]